MQKTCLKGTVRPPCWSVGVFYRNQVGLWLRPTFVVGSNLVCETSRLQVRDRQRPHRLFVRLFRDLVIIAFEVSNIPRYFWVCFFYYTSIDSLDESKERQKQLGRRSYFQDFRSDFVIKLYNSFKFVERNGTIFDAFLFISIRFGDRKKDRSIVDWNRREISWSRVRRNHRLVQFPQPPFTNPFPWSARRQRFTPSQRFVALFLYYGVMVSYRSRDLSKIIFLQI